MELFLQILGGIVLFIVLAILAIYLYIRIKLGKYYNCDADSEETPLLIHLNEDPMPEWTSGKHAQSIEQSLLDLQFKAGKVYTIYEMPGYQLKAFFNSPYTAVMYYHEIAGLWIDIVAETVDGLAITVSNAPMGEALNNRAGTDKHFHKTYQAAELFEKIKALVNDQSCIKVDENNFREYFETEYKKDMLWKNRNGGISLEEFIDTAKATNKNYSDSAINEAFIETKCQELGQWHYAALEEYKNLHKTSHDDFEEIEYNLIIVPSQTNTIAYIDYLYEHAYLTEENSEKFKKIHDKDMDITRLFETINESFSPELRATKFGEVDYPIQISIYKIRDLAHNNW